MHTYILSFLDKYTYHSVHSNIAKLDVFITYMYYYTFSSRTLFWLAESLQWIFEISARDVKTCRLYNNHVKVTRNHVKVTGNHVTYDRGAWFLRVIMSSSRALCCLVSAKKQKKLLQFFRSMYNKTFIRFGFCDIQNNRCHDHMIMWVSAQWRVSSDNFL